MSKKETEGLVWLAIVGFPIYWIVQLFDEVGTVPIAFVVVAAILLIIIYKSARKKQRRNSLLKKYQDKQLVDDLMARKFWQGQTVEQLRDSLGKPAEIDSKALKTKKKEVWKYNHRGGNRYGLRITLDNDTVIGWDQKS